MKRAVQWVWGSGILIGVGQGAALGVLAALINARTIEPAFYEAIAAAIPILLLATLVHIHAAGERADASEARRLDLAARIEEASTAAVDSLRAAERLEGAIRREGDDAGLLSTAQEQLRRSQSNVGELASLQERVGRFGGNHPVDNLVRLTIVCFIAAAIGEVAALTALASGASNPFTFLSACVGIATLANLLVLMELMTLTRERDLRRASRRVN